MKKICVHVQENKFLEVHDQLTFLGSCFSEHIALSAQKLAFNTLSNPFGVLFNPKVLSNSILWNEEEWLDSTFQTQDKFLSWNTNSLVWDLDQKKLVAKLLSLREKLLEHLTNSKTLFVTFGTAWIYEHQDFQQIVASCHKQPHRDFRKRCMKTDEIVQIWNDTLSFLKSLNPDLNVVFTVSPIRHKKDGLVENNLSKSRLINAVHEIITNHKDTYYFPSYEIIIDELRDYAYFEKDGVHPNIFAIEEVESRFYKSFLSGEASITIQKFKAIKDLLSHRLLHEGSKEANELSRERLNKRTEFLKSHPGFRDFLK
jgi:hypothetical protein